MRKVALFTMVLAMITAAGCENIHDDTPLSPPAGGLRTTTAEGGQDHCETQIIYDPETCSGYGGDEYDPDGTVYTYTTGDDGSPSDTWFADAYDEAACPPGFKARYHAAGKGLWFNGFSTFTMSQWDQHHTYRLNTYEYTGYSTDKKWKITGIHHVADVCEFPKLCRRSSLNSGAIQDH
jgi:hypothetical protein